MNFNDAKITSLYVSEPGAVKDIQDDAPNANTATGTKFRVTLEMVAGTGVGGKYDVKTTCSDLTDTAAAPGLNPGAPLNATGDLFQTGAWVADGPNRYVFNQSELISKPTVRGHVYRYTASLYSDNGQIVSIRESDPFVLL
jgi:hypothetical protein